MERNQESLLNDRTKLLSEIESLSKILIDQCNHFDRQDLMIVRSMASPPQFLILVFTAACEALNANFEGDIWQFIMRYMVSARHFVQKLIQVSQFGEPIPKDRLIKIKEIYEAYPDLTLNSFKSSSFAGNLSKWVQIYVDLSQKKHKMNEIQ